MEFFKIAKEWLSNKAVPIKGEATFNVDGEKNSIPIKGSIDFRGEHAVLNITVKDNSIKRYNVAIYKMTENTLQCVYVDFANPNKFAIFELEKDI